MAVLWISWFALCSKDIYKLHYAEVYRYLGIVLTVMGAVGHQIKTQD